MTGPGRRSAAWALLLAAVLFAAGCDSRKHKVEILESPIPSGDPPVKIASSDEAAPFFRKVADAYASRKRIRLDLFETQSRNIPELLLSGSVDIGVTSGGIPAEAAGKNLSYVPFAHDAIAFIASPDAGVRSLTSSQIRRILSGEIDDWREVGGKAGHINVVDRPPTSVTRVSLGKALFGGKFPPAGHAVVAETSELAIQAMRRLPGYFGFGPLSRLTVEQIPGVLVAVDGMPALAPSAPGNGYPARVEYGIMFRKDAPETVKELAGFFLTPEGGHELATLGLTPSAKGLSMAACHCRKQEGIFLPAGKKSVLAGTFTLAVVPELGAITQENRYSGVLQRIADGMGVRTRLMHLSSYDQVIEEFHEGRIDAAFVGSLMYGKLRQRAGVIPLARPEKQGKSMYHGLILVRKADRIAAFADLRGKRLAYVPNTSAGELFAKSKVSEAGGEWPGYFGRTVRASSHETAVELLLSGEADVAAVKDLVLDRMAASRPALRKAFTVLSFSTTFPENALVVSQHLGETDRASLRRILLSLHEIPGGLDALRSLGADRMVPTSDQDYAGMYGLARKVGYRLDGGG
ncbi:MAG: PhnD/SsuA/transferrin family substrate-binding protein [Deltaproteobacteria bacterium]|nr:PhnD/SsuA/transferrin family substrate-binding protein [Deltaproteobacteria bacterium]